MGQFIINKCDIEGLFIIEPRLFADARGYVYESYNKEDFYKAGMDLNFVQSNHAKSCQGVLRGLHFQMNHPQGKLVRVIKGEVYDVAVDLRKNSKTCGKWHAELLSEENKKLFYVPEGFAHGFYVVSKEAEFEYQCTDFYHPEEESGIRYNDPFLDILWPITAGTEPIISDKDSFLPKYGQFFF